MWPYAGFDIKNVKTITSTKTFFMNSSTLFSILRTDYVLPVSTSTTVKHYSYMKTTKKDYEPNINAEMQKLQKRIL